MTISTLVRKTIANGDGVSTAFGFAFQVRAAADLQIYLTDVSGNITGPLASNLYSVVLNAVPTGQLWSNGGTVTYPLSGSPIASGTTITIARTVSFLQSASLINQGGYYPQTVEQALDLITMEVQQVNETASRAVTLPITASGSISAILATPLAGAAIGWDPTGLFLVNIVTAGSLSVSSFGNSMMNQASASAARTLLALGTMAIQNASAVVITGGTIAGITALAVADGGTGAGTAANARTNLGFGTSLTAALTKQQTRQTFTSGSGATYTTPTGATRINVRLIGGGAGGGGATANDGTDGNDTTFGASLTGSGGKKGVNGGGTSFGGAGGAAAGGDINIPGGGGVGGVTGSAGNVYAGGLGGNGVFGGAGAGNKNTAGGNGATNSGAGGSGGGNTDNSTAGGGGGAGGYVEKLIVTPAATYTYTVGAAANGGAAGTKAGGNGAAGQIIVDEFYN